MADAVIAVSREAKKRYPAAFQGRCRSKVHVIHNGIDLERIPPHAVTGACSSNTGSILAKPYVLFVGRITRQKGIIHLVNALKYMDTGFSGRPLRRSSRYTGDRAGDEGRALPPSRKARQASSGYRRWSTPTKIALYSHAAIFCCPSIYEPFGIINLEAMACEIPVVASAVGGIKEVVVEGETGLLVPANVDQGKTGT